MHLVGDGFIALKRTKKIAILSLVFHRIPTQSCPFLGLAWFGECGGEQIRAPKALMYRSDFKHEVHHSQCWDNRPERSRASLKRKTSLLCLLQISGPLLWVLAATSINFSSSAKAYLSALVTCRAQPRTPWAGLYLQMPGVTGAMQSICNWILSHCFKLSLSLWSSPPQNLYDSILKTEFCVL